MGKRNARKPYRVIGAYDSETANIVSKGAIYAYPVTHQLGLIDCPIEDINPENVEQHCIITIDRHAVDLYTRLDDIAGSQLPYVPVILCHNLSFDMYGLAPYLDGHDCKVLAKSQRKPITFTVLDDAGKPALVIWDTLVFSQQSLERMGNDCGYHKAIGQWDYNLLRTPETPLSDDEVEYAKADIYTLLVWVSWWLKRNPDITPEMLGLNVVTKTGVVRMKRKQRFAKLGKGRANVGSRWLYMNRKEAPASDDELFTMQAATRGGLVFCASAFASIPFELQHTGQCIAAYDATSQHPAQMVSHRYPVQFHQTSAEVLELAFTVISRVPLSRILSNWSKPFVKAVYAAYTFEHLRPRQGSLYERWGIFPLASARFKSYANAELDEDNGDMQAQDDKRREMGYADYADNPVFAFGKLVSADRCTVYLTELAIWEISRCYEWDSLKAEHGYITGRFARPTDLSIISVMQFYKAKNAFKDARREYLRTGSIANGSALRALGVADSVVSDMEKGLLSTTDLDATYLQLKADLNALYGIECSNEYRRDTVLTSSGITYTGEMGICNAPKNPKAWYQFGQRIVGWSRISQVCVIELLAPYVHGVINGDTDSIKVLVDESKLPNVDIQLGKLAHAIDNGKFDNCARVYKAYPALYDKLQGIGHYVREFTAYEFCAAWNKAYCEIENGHFTFTLAGLPTADIYKKDGEELKLFAQRLNGFADALHANGASFGDICDTLLSYNATYTHQITGLNARKFPEWADLVNEWVTDYQGNTAHVIEPHALALYPMPKTIGSFTFRENRDNYRYAVMNRPTVNNSPIIISNAGIVKVGA